MSLNVCIFGVSGYTGSKLLHFLDRHKNVNINGVFGESTLGQKLGQINKNLTKYSQLKIIDFNDFNFDNTDLIFSCLPHGKFQSEIVKVIDPKIPIIDLSGDFRLESVDEYEKFYECKHKTANLKKNYTYGLSEIYRDKIKKSKFVSNPGCYPTSILIPLIPLLREKKFQINDVIVDSKSGISGAGKKLKIENLFAEISENFFSYGVNKHRHYPEIKQEIDKFNNDISITFIPHVIPIISGMQSTIYFNRNQEKEEYENVLSSFYKDEMFIKIYKDSNMPCIKDVKGTNNVAIKVFNDYSRKKIVIVSCIDNLIKCASGQAVQNMNIMHGFNEIESLV